MNQPAVLAGAVANLENRRGLTGMVCWNPATWAALS